MRQVSSFKFQVSNRERLLIFFILFSILAPGTSSVFAEDPRPKENRTGLEQEEETNPAEPSQEDEPDQDEDFDFFDEDIPEEQETIADPIEPFNRAMFQFNDKLYFWVIRPTARGYRFLIPEQGRVGVKMFFSNITTPIRFINLLLQLKFKGATIELGRFIVNSTIGLAGFRDPASDFGLDRQDEDFGQTLGAMGIGPGFYINLPFFGPSSLRDSIGLAGDTFLDPATYLPSIMLHSSLSRYELVVSAGITGYEAVNKTSLNMRLYDELLREGLDPYTFIKDAYYQSRESKIKD